MSEPRVTKMYPMICCGMKISQLNMTEHTQTNGVLDRIMTERREAEEYLVTAMPNMYTKEAEMITPSDRT